MFNVIGEYFVNCLLDSNNRHPHGKRLDTGKERFDRTESVAPEKKTRTKSVLNELNQLANCFSVVGNP